MGATLSMVRSGRSNLSIVMLFSTACEFFFFFFLESVFTNPAYTRLTCMWPLNTKESGNLRSPLHIALHVVTCQSGLNPVRFSWRKKMRPIAPRSVGEAFLLILILTQTYWNLMLPHIVLPLWYQVKPNMTAILLTLITLLIEKLESSVFLFYSYCSHDKYLLFQLNFQRLGISANQSQNLLSKIFTLWLLSNDFLIDWWFLH